MGFTAYLIRQKKESENSKISHLKLSSQRSKIKNEMPAKWPNKMTPTHIQPQQQ